MDTRKAVRVFLQLLIASVLAPPVLAIDLGDFKGTKPEVWFDLPRAVTVQETFDNSAAPLLAPGERLFTVELPVSVLVNKGDLSRVEEVVFTVDGGAGLTVHDYSPKTRLETDFTGDIEVHNTTENERHFEASLGGRLPIGGAIAQLTPGVSLGRGTQATEVESLARRPPKQAVVVSSTIHERRGVLFKIRPYSQTTLEGEHTLRVTFIASAGWDGGSLDVDCQATGKRKVLFVEQPTTWSQKMAPVALRVTNQATDTPTLDEPPAVSQPIRQTAAKPVVAKQPSEFGNGWRARTAEPF